jgi:hypothetical protein
MTRGMTRRQHAVLLSAIGVLCLTAGVLTPAVREVALVVGVFFVLLAVGVTVWDPRGGH